MLSICLIFPECVTGRHEGMTSNFPRTGIQSWISKFYLILAEWATGNGTCCSFLERLWNFWYNISSFLVHFYSKLAKTETSLRNWDIPYRMTLVQAYFLPFSAFSLFEYPVLQLRLITHYRRGFFVQFNQTTLKITCVFLFYFTY